jgi:tetratricopeptide (TPR) repeat protein
MLERAKRNGNKNEEAGAYLNLGKAFEENKQFEKAIECFNNVLKIAKNQKDTEQEMNAYLGLASAYAANNEPDVEKEYLKKALEPEIIGCYNKDPSKFKNKDVIKKLSTSDFNEGLPIIKCKQANVAIQKSSTFSFILTSTIYFFEKN